MKLTRCHFQIATKMVDKYCRYNPSPLSIQKFVDYGNQASEKKAYIFLRKELPVRLANIMKEINLLPPQLLSTQSCQLVIGWYKRSFQEILEFENVNPEQNVLDNFVESLTTIRNRHSDVVQTMAHGILEMRESGSDKNNEMEKQIQYFLDRFYISRISIRMLINQHTLLFGENGNGDSNTRHIGCIDPSCDVLMVAEDAYDNARFLCDQYYTTSPEIDFICHNPYEEQARVQVTYTPSHLYHMLFELLKNAMRAVVEYHDHDNVTELPRLKMMICKGKDDVTIKICDQGGGIPFDQLNLLFNYMYSTAPKPPPAYASSTTPLAGYGYGLPLSRLYAKYFNGDLTLSSVEGYGTDAVIYLKVFPSEANELLPIYNNTSYKQLTSPIQISDWSDPLKSTGLHSAFPAGSQRNYHTQRRQYSTTSLPHSLTPSLVTYAGSRTSQNDNN